MFTFKKFLIATPLTLAASLGIGVAPIDASGWIPLPDPVIHHEPELEPYEVFDDFLRLELDVLDGLENGYCLVDLVERAEAIRARFTTIANNAEWDLRAAVERLGNAPADSLELDRAVADTRHQYRLKARAAVYARGTTHILEVALGTHCEETCCSMEPRIHGTGWPVIETPPVVRPAPTPDPESK